jgi:hypothetical protein
MPVSINGNGAISGLVITTADLSDGSVTTAKIAAGAVATVDIADSAVTTAKIADTNVTTAKIAANAVTVAKLAREGSSGQVLTSNGAGSDPSYQTISTTPTTAQVLTATAGASGGAVGTYALCRDLTGSSIGIGGTRSGSSLVYSAAYGTGATTSSGTWRCIGSTSYGNCQPQAYMTTLWLRIS